MRSNITAMHTYANGLFPLSQKKMKYHEQNVEKKTNKNIRDA